MGSGKSLPLSAEMCNGRWPKCRYRTTVLLNGNDGARLQTFDYGAQSWGWDVDDSNKFYVSGIPNRKCRTDTINVKSWDSSGNLQWAGLDSAATGVSNITHLGAVPSGGCVTVYMPNATASATLYVTRRSAAGAVIWQRTLVPATFSPSSIGIPFYVWCSDTLAFVMCTPTGGTTAIVWAFNLTTSNPVSVLGNPVNVYSGSALKATAFYPDLIEGGSYSTNTVGATSGLSRRSVTGSILWNFSLASTTTTSVGMVGSSVYWYGYTGGVETLYEIDRATGVILSTTPLAGAFPATAENRAVFGPNRVFVRDVSAGITSIRCYDFSGTLLWQTTTTDPAAREPRADRFGNVLYSNNRVRDNYPL